jgi:PAP2 superfamily
MAWEKLFGSHRATHRPGLVVPICISIGWAAIIIAVARFVSFEEPYLPFVIAGAAVFFLRCVPSRGEVCVWLVASGVFVGIVHLPQVPFWILRVASSAASLGFGGLLLLGLRAIWSEAESRSNTVVLLATSLILVFFIFGTARVLQFSGGASPLTDDAWLYAFDGTLGFQPSFVMGRILFESVLLTRCALLVYLSLPFAMAVVCAWQVPVGERRMQWHMLTVLLLAGAGGWLLYNIVPGTGPIYAFTRDFPMHSIAYKNLPGFVLQKMAIPTMIPRNAMPSLHVGWALLLWWNCRKFPAGLRAAMLGFLGFTVIATLGTGQHYLVDLVVSLPFALAVQAAASYRLPRWRRVIAFTAGIGAVAAWLALIRFGVQVALLSSAIPWTLISVTVLLCARLKVWMSREGSSASAPAKEIAIAAAGLIGSTR